MKCNATQRGERIVVLSYGLVVPLSAPLFAPCSMLSAGSCRRPVVSLSCCQASLLAPRPLLPAPSSRPESADTLRSEVRNLRRGSHFFAVRPLLPRLIRLFVKKNVPELRRQVQNDEVADLERRERIAE
jgi:hypothetical protein